MIGALGILLSLTPPGQHAQCVERSVGSLAGRRWAVYASISFTFLISYRSMVVFGLLTDQMHYPMSIVVPRILMFLSLVGAVSHLSCLTSMVAVKDAHRFEVGVCLRYSRSTLGAYEFLLSDKQVVVRDFI